MLYLAYAINEVYSSLKRLHTCRRLHRLNTCTPFLWVLCIIKKNYVANRRPSLFTAVFVTRRSSKGYLAYQGPLYLSFSVVSSTRMSSVDLFSFSKAASWHLGTVPLINNSIFFFRHWAGVRFSSLQGVWSIASNDSTSISSTRRLLNPV